MRRRSSNSTSLPRRPHGVSGRRLRASSRPAISSCFGAISAPAKTALARALVQSHLGQHGLSDDVPSPSFTLVQTYESPALLVIHVDLYRVEDPSELRELGLAEAVDEGVVIVEWPERAEREMQRLSRDRLDISLTLVREGMRHARLEGFGSWAARLEGLTI